MGIQGLLQFIKDASEPVHVKKYRGQTVAVDTYCWIHKGAFSCAEKLAKGEPTDQYVRYCMKFVDMLLSFGVKPILVFDGCNLPSKKEVEKSRRERRQANLQKGKQLLREGKLSEARDCFTKSVNVTPSMAHDVIKAARTRGVDCVVAPYEADAQLAFLSKVGLAQAVITEDSDLLAFGCKKVLLKMDREGNGLEIDQAHLGRCRSLGGVFTEEKFRHMCILSGCDYLASLYGVGLGKACKLLKMANNPDILTVIRKMGQYLKMSMAVPEEYLEGFVKADNTFLYQLVFDPLRRKVVPLNPYPEHLDPSTLGYAGLNKGDESGYQMALGNLDLHTLERIDDFDPDRPARPPAVKPRSRRWGDPAAPARPGSGGASSSIWSRGYAAGAASTTTAAAGVKEEQHPRPPSTRGQERVVAVGLRGLLGAKRPREDSSVSDQDVLQLYSPAPDLKRARSEEEEREREEKPSLPRPAGGSSSGAAPRNRFATLLQRRNQGGEGDGQTTRSRFFSASCEPTGSSSTEGETVVAAAAATRLSGAVEEVAHGGGGGDGDSDGPDAPSLETPSPPSTPTPTTDPAPHTASSSTSPRPASQGLGVFRWSGLSQPPTTTTTSSSHSSSSSVRPSPAAPSKPVVSGIAALQQYQRTKTGGFSRASGPPGAPAPPPDPPHQAVHKEEEEEEEEEQDSPPASPPSQDSAYFSQSQPCCDLTSCEADEAANGPAVVSHLSSPWRPEDAAEADSGAKGSDRSPSHAPRDPKRSPVVAVRTLVAGLPRSRPSNQGAEPPAKLRPLAPARASGLRRRPPGLGVFRWSGLSQPPTTTTTSSSHSSSSSVRPSPAAPSKPVVSGIAALQQYQRTKTGGFSRASGPPGAPAPPPDPPHQAVHKEEEEEEEEEQDSPPASPPSQDSAYFSQSQPCCDLTSCEADEAANGPAVVSHLSSPWRPEDAAEADSGAKGSDRSPSHAPRDPKRSPVVAVRTLVAGLPRSRPSNQGAEPPAKLRPLAPARASGLRRRPPGSRGPAGKKSPNNENSSPAMQATISSLWKNFGFKREPQQLSPGPRGPLRGPPMSPVKDNLR